MQKKNIIQILVIAVCFLISGIVLYKGLFQGGSAPELATEGANVQNEEILPQGASFDIDKAFKNSSFNFKQVNFPKIDLDNDLGTAEQDLVIPFEDEIK